MEILGTTKVKGHMDMQPKKRILIDVTSGEAKFIAENLERVLKTGQVPYTWDDGENVLMIYFADE